MKSRSFPSAGWAAYFSAIVAILGLVSLILFFSLESTPGTTQAPHVWGPVSDIAPILQMGALLIVGLALYKVRQPRSARLALIGSAIGIVGILGVMLLQFLLIIKVIPFEQEVGPVLYATAAVGFWLIIMNDIGRRQGSLSARLAWLGIAVGAAFLLEPVMLSLAGGAAAWRVFMSNGFLLAASAVVFLVSYIGFPIWAFWLWRVLQRQPG